MNLDQQLQWKIFCKSFKKLTIKGNYSLRGKLTIFIICRSYFAEHYCCLQFIAIYNSIQDNQKRQNFFKNYQLEGSNPTTSCPIHLKNSGQIDIDLINNLTSCQICSRCFGFIVISQKLHFTPMFYFQPWRPSWLNGQVIGHIFQTRYPKDDCGLVVSVEIL